jgi:hypothetical protein
VVRSSAWKLRIMRARPEGSIPTVMESMFICRLVKHLETLIMTPGAFSHRMEKMRVVM